MLNKTQLIGRLGQKDVRSTPNGMQVVSYSIATTKSLKDRETGEWKENTEWHRCVSFNKTAEHIGMNVEPGDLLFLEGELRTRKWQTQSGEDRYTTEIVVNDFPRKLPKYFSKNGSQQAAPTPQPQQQAHASPSQPGHLEQPPVEAYGFDDDYPF
ncbi:single-stranded DNA-binding protein [Marinobacter adhaerens]|jgi:single-strand DNA-binding protein|uniref:single-stranded DNA-binding protein n=1 Tax=Marinobacter adhaerens TaxID=1033846 RepID=UPI001E2A9551|nr:single-stranded DNA-binding protein [Marinobacter adhaerens]MCD1649732.1 single-stranded DNA-binding protein [Marinobacter adhaerens]